MNAFLRPIRETTPREHMHRSGWPYVLRSLESLFDDTANVVFDDFLEKTIFNRRQGLKTHVHTRPWVGVCHYPYDAPSWYDTEHLHEISNQSSWAESLAKLELCIALGENLAAWIRNQWNVQCIVLKHPSEIPNTKWSEDAFLINKEPLLLQVGWYLRNTHAIFQVDAPAFLSKAWLRSRRNIAETNHARCASHFHPTRIYKGTVRVIEPVNNAAYDDLLSNNVVFVELMASVANNTIVECVARNTPIVVNRHPGPEFYLGAEYPLFYETIADVNAMLTLDNILAAHRYLKNLDKQWLDGSTFRDSLASECIARVPSIGNSSNLLFTS